MEKISFEEKEPKQELVITIMGTLLEDLKEIYQRKYVPKNEYINNIQHLYINNNNYGEKSPDRKEHFQGSLKSVLCVSRIITREKVRNHTGNSNREAGAGNCQQQCIGGIDKIKKVRDFTAFRNTRFTEHIERNGEKKADHFTDDAGNSQNGDSLCDGFYLFRHTDNPFRS